VHQALLQKLTYPLITATRWRRSLLILVASILQPRPAGDQPSDGDYFAFLVGYVTASLISGDMPIARSGRRRWSSAEFNECGDI